MEMRQFSWFDRIVGLVGLLLGVPTLLAFFKQQFVSALLLLIIILLIVGYLLYRYMDKQRKIREIKENSLFTHLDVDGVLTFKDATGNTATQTTKLHAQANHTGITQLWFRNLTADGPIQNFKIDGAPVPSNLIRRKAGSYEVCKEFEHPLRAGETCKVTLQYDLLNSFGGSTEGVTHVVFTETQHLKLRVEFDSKRIGREPTFFMERGGGIAERLAKPPILGNVIEAEQTSPQVGAYYTLEWVW